MDSIIDFLNQHKTLIFYIFLGVSLILTRIPLIGKYFRLVNTMIHEAGHAFMTLIVSGEVISVNLFADTSGTTVTKAKNKFLQFLIAFAGYPASSITGFLFIMMLSKGYNLYILFILTSIALLLMVLSIRNGYGLFWAGTFSLINLLLLYFNVPLWIYIASAFYSLIVLCDSVISTVILFVLSIKTPNKAGDASNLQKFTKVPAVIWSILFMGIAGFMAYNAVVYYFPSFTQLLN